MTFFPIIITLAAAALALSVARVFSQPLKLLDRPSSRKQHVGAVPLVGGIAIFVGGWSGLWVVSGQIDGLWPLWIASLLIFLVGLQDDRVNLSVKPRFLVEVVAVSLLVFAANVSLTNLGDLFGFGEIELGWFAFPFTLIAVVGVINALNMVDGVDGLAGTLSIITLAAMGVMAWSAGRVAEGWVALLFILATLPYLFCNLGICGFERRVFLGDAGSMLLGFVIAWLAVTLSHPSHLGEPAVFAPVTALWLFAIPLMDTVAIMVRRLLKGQSPFLPDRDHLHHIVMRAGYRDRHALLMISLSAVIMVGVGLWMEFIAVDESIRFAWFIGLAAIYMFMLQHVWRLIRLIKAFRQQINHSLWLLLNPLTGLSRPVKQFVLLVLDGLLIYAALIAALLLRFGEWHVVSIYFGGPLSFGVWGAPLLAYPIFSWFGLYRSIIRFFGSQALWAAGRLLRSVVSRHIQRYCPILFWCSICCCCCLWLEGREWWPVTC